MSASTTLIHPPSILGKRNRASGQYLLRLNSSPEPADSDFERPVASSSKSLPVLINGTLVSHTKKRYKCTRGGCNKAYSKPSRLEEHERSHSGQVGNSFKSVYSLVLIYLSSAHLSVKNAPSRTYAKPISKRMLAVTFHNPTGLSVVPNQTVKRDFGLHNICVCTLIGTTVQSLLL